MLRTAFSLLSPAGRQASLSVLIFHRVLPRPDPLFPDEVDAARFDRVCKWIKQWFNVLPLDEAVRRLGVGQLPARAMAITFDDGYRDNCELALPILKRHGLSATFFVATGYLDGGRMWNDTIVETLRCTALPTLDVDDLLGTGYGAMPLGDATQRRQAIDRILPVVKYRLPAERLRITSELTGRARVGALPDDLMMDSEQVVQLHRAGMQIGAHTVTHPILSRIAEPDVLQELSQSKAGLEALIGSTVSLFAYPNGAPGTDFGEREVQAARTCGFAAAVTTGWGVARSDTDVYRLPRFTPWGRTRARFALGLARNIRSGRASSVGHLMRGMCTSAASATEDLQSTARSVPHRDAA
jgi:peptidoglycan/xylan/chitin deacetylase (PgdA/CDA1 family)